MHLIETERKYFETENVQLKMNREVTKRKKNWIRIELKSTVLHNTYFMYST